MTELLTAAQMRAIEQAAIDSGEVTGLELMERAGRGVVEAIFEEWPELARTDHRAVVLCGPGNNGGDGFVVARLLKEWGWEVEVFLYGDAGNLPPDAKVNYERWAEMGELLPLSLEIFEKRGGHFYIYDAALYIDALFGTGLTRPVGQEILDVFEELKGQMNGQVSDPLPRLVAIDIPSGFCSDSGKFLVNSITNGNFNKSYLNPELTVSFHRQKLGLNLDIAVDVCGFFDLFEETRGLVVVCDIGLKEYSYGNYLADSPMRELSRVCVTSPITALRTLNKDNSSHKYDHGHALVLSGGVGKGGAARLAACGALRIGAGVVTVGCPPSALQENAGALEAVMVRSVKGAEWLGEALQDERINALCLGPGLGVERAAELVAVALGDGGVEPRPTVLDADALTALAGDAGLFGRLREGCVLTPHAGEFARLFPDIAEKLKAPATKGPAYSKVDATREAAARAECVVLFKGADTVIAAPDGRCSINSAHYERSAPWLATAGTGDVLAGFITGLLARGFAPMQAAETGAWLHVECALKFGPGLIAEDLPGMLPGVFRDLGV